MSASLEPGHAVRIQARPGVARGPRTVVATGISRPARTRRRTASAPCPVTAVPSRAAPA